MSRRFSTGTCSKDTDDALMSVLPEHSEGPNNSFRRSRRQSCPDTDEEGPRSPISPSNRRMSRRQSWNPGEDGLGQMRRTLQNLRSTDGINVRPDKLSDEGRLSERFQSSRTNQSQTVNDVARPKLDRIELFQQCTPCFIEALSHQLENAVFDAGREIIKQGDIGTDMFLLNFGEVEVVVGEAELVVATLGSGALFGEMAVISKNPVAARRTATIRAKTYCHCWSIDRPALLRLLATYPKDEAVLSTEADRKLQDLIKKGLVKDPNLDKRDEFRHATKDSLTSRVRNKLRAMNTVARLGRKTISDENVRQSYESAVSKGRASYDEGGRESSRRTFEDVGRNTFERNTYESVASRNTYEECGRNSYESTSRRTFESVGRHTSEFLDTRHSVKLHLEEDLQSARSTCDESRLTGEVSFRKPFENFPCIVVHEPETRKFTPRSNRPSKDDILDSCQEQIAERRSFAIHLGKQETIDDDIGRKTTQSNRPSVSKTTVAMLLRPSSENSTELGTRESFCSHTDSESVTSPAGWASAGSPSRRLPPLKRDRQKHSPSKKSWHEGETSEVTKARSTAQSFLASRGMQPMEPSQEKGIPIELLFDCLPSHSAKCN